MTLRTASSARIAQTGTTRKNSTSSTGMPIEELLFFLVVPVCAVLAFEAVRTVTGWNAGYDGTDDG